MPDLLLAEQVKQGEGLLQTPRKPALFSSLLPRLFGALHFVVVVVVVIVVGPKRTAFLNCFAGC